MDLNFDTILIHRVRVIFIYKSKVRFEFFTTLIDPMFNIVNQSMKCQNHFIRERKKNISSERKRKRKKKHEFTNFKGSRMNVKIQQGTQGGHQERKKYLFIQTLE